MLPAAMAQASAQLAPAGPDGIMKALAPVLALIAPSGMSADDREEWQTAAADALKGIPADLLAAGVKLARRTCDHPAKVVATIMGEVEGLWRRRRNDRETVRWLAALTTDSSAGGVAEQVETQCTADQAAAIKAEFGLAGDTEKRAAVRANLGQPRAPTACDVGEIAASMGIAPAAGDGLPPVADIRGLTRAQIFEQRDRNRARALMDMHNADMGDDYDR